MKAKLIERIVHKKLENLNINFKRKFSDWNVPYLELLSPNDEVKYLRIGFYPNEAILWSEISHSHITDHELRRTRRKPSQLAKKKSVARTTVKQVRKIVNGLVYMSQTFDEEGNHLGGGSGPIEYSASNNPENVLEMSRIHGAPVVIKEWNWFGPLELKTASASTSTPSN